jgi:hypothetical protein
LEEEMRFTNDADIQIKFCVYKTAGWADNIPCEGGAVFIDAGGSKDWFPAPGEHSETFDVRVFRPALFDELLDRATDKVNRGARLRVYKASNKYVLELSNTLKYHKIEIPYPTMVEDVTSLDELRMHMRNAASQRLRIRAVGGGYSFSDVAHTDGCFLYTNRLNKGLEIDKTVLKDSVAVDNLRQFEAGIKVQALNDALWSEGKALINQGGYDQQTLIGALCTGTHGSGITLGTIASAVRSVHLITLDNDWALRELRIEPTDGITDPVAHKAKFPSIKLIQNDNVFYSAVVSFGAMGVVYSAIIEVRSAYWLNESRIKQPWATTKQQLIEGLLQDKQYRHIEVLVNPYKKTSVLTKRKEVVAGAPSGNRNIMQTEIAKIEVIIHAIQDAANNDPSMVPNMLESALNGTTDDNVVGKCFDMLNIGPANEFPVVSSEVGVDATDIKNVIAATESLMTLLDYRARTDNRYITSPFSLRFVRADKHFLSMAYGRDTCMIEVPMLSATYGLEETLRRIREHLEDQFDGRSHWGQIIEINADKLHKKYPMAAIVKGVYKDMNVSGAFSSEMTSRIGFDA